MEHLLWECAVSLYFLPDTWKVLGLTNLSFIRVFCLLIVTKCQDIQLMFDLKVFHFII